MSRPARSCRTAEAQPPANNPTIIIHSKPTPLPSSITFKHFPSVGVHAIRPKSSSSKHDSDSTKEANDREAAATSLCPPTPSEKKIHTDYLNRECMALISRQLDEVTENVLRMEQLSKECSRFLDMFDPRLEPKRKERLTLTFQPVKYEPTLLPVVICRCYPNLVDRSLIVQGLVKDLESQSHRRSCVCVLRSRCLEDDSLLADVLSQCTNRDPKGDEFKRHQRRKQQRDLFPSIISCTQYLIDWCSYTEEFDEVIILLEDPESIPLPQLEPFFATLSSLRSSHGVPISLIVMDCSPGGFGDKMSTLRPLRGAMVKVVNVPLPEDLFERFINELNTKKCIPLFLWQNKLLWEYIEDMFHEEDNSIVGSARRIKIEFTRYFSLPGSSAFVSMLNCEEVVLSNWNIISWLVNQPLEEESSICGSGGCVDRLLSDVTMSLLVRPVYQLLRSMENSSPIARCDVLKLLEQMYIVQKKMKAECMTVLSVRANDLVLDNYTILVTKVISRAKLDEAKEQTKIRALLAQIKKMVIKSCTNQLHRLPTLPISPAPQPRRDTAKAFSALPTAINSSLAHAVRIAYLSFRLKNMRLSDWYEEYFTMVASYPGVSSNESLFFIAVEELVLCGFVHVVPSYQEEPVYEKIICWATLDDDAV